MAMALARPSKDATDPLSDRVRIEEAVHQRLRESGYAPLRSVACRRRATTIVLTGRVPSFYLKQIAQTLVIKTEGVEQVENLLEVVAE